PPCYFSKPDQDCEVFGERGVCQLAPACGASARSWFHGSPCLECVLPPDPVLDDPGPPPGEKAPPSTPPPRAVPPPRGPRLAAVAGCAAAVLAIALLRRRRARRP